MARMKAAENLTPPETESLEEPIKRDAHKYRLAQTRLPTKLYEELTRRARAERRDISNYMKWWLELTFKEFHPDRK